MPPVIKNYTGEYFNKIQKKAAAVHHPISAMFELTYRCNLACRHCYVCRSRGKRELDTAGACAVIDKLASGGVFNLTFTGGEPLARRDFFEIAAYARRRGFQISLFTNATLIGSREARTLAHLSPVRIDVSFHSTDPKTFDWFTQRQGSFDRTLEGIRLLRRKKLEVYAKTMAMNFNKFDLINLRRLAIEGYGAHFRFGGDITRRWDRKGHAERFRLEPEELHSLGKAINNESEIEREEMPTVRPSKTGRGRIPADRLEKYFCCLHGRNSVVVDPYGWMRFCIDLPFPKYNLVKGLFAEGWSQFREYLAASQTPRDFVCRNCELVFFCRYCPAVAWLECGTLNACPEKCRKEAEAAMRMRKQGGKAWQ